MSKTDHNQHLLNALSSIEFHPDKCFVDLEGQTIHFTIQRGPIKDNGRNGCDATDIINYAIGLYTSFNKASPCRENSMTITKLQEALHWQWERTKDKSESLF